MSSGSSRISDPFTLPARGQIRESPPQRDARLPSPAPARVARKERLRRDLIDVVAAWFVGSDNALDRLDGTYVGDGFPAGLADAVKGRRRGRHLRRLSANR